VKEVKSKRILELRIVQMICVSVESELGAEEE
jgi:hypothetical protein